MQCDSYLSTFGGVAATDGNEGDPIVHHGNHNTDLLIANTKITQHMGRESHNTVHHNSNTTNPFFFSWSIRCCQLKLAGGKFKNDKIKLKGIFFSMKLGSWRGGQIL